MSENEMMNTGSCRFCGQLHHIDEDEELTTAQADELATMQCTCTRAVEYQKAIKRKEKAMKNVDLLFGEDAPQGKQLSSEIVEILKFGVEEIYGGELAKITLNIRGGVKAMISQNGKGEINVEREEKKKQKLTE